MNSAESRLQALAQGTTEMFVKHGKADLAPDTSKMRSIYFNMQRKYLGNYVDMNTRLDILTEAWTTAVAGRVDTVIKAFTGINTAPSRQGAKVKAEEWVAMVVKNALINVSIKYNKQVTDLNPDDELNPAISPDYAKGSQVKVERYDDEYESALKGYIDDTTRALESLPENKKMSKTRLEGSLKRLQTELDSLNAEGEKPTAEFSEVYDIYDTDADQSDGDYTKRLMMQMLVRLEPKAQAVLVGLFYGMTPAEFQFAFGWDVKAHLDNIKRAVQDLAKDESWEFDNPDLAESLAFYKMGARDLSRVKADTAQEELQDKFKDCIAEFADEMGFGFKAKELYEVAFHEDK